MKELGCNFNGPDGRRIASFDLLTEDIAFDKVSYISAVVGYSNEDHNGVDDMSNWKNSSGGLGDERNMGTEDGKDVAGQGRAVGEDTGYNSLKVGTVLLLEIFGYLN